MSENWTTTRRRFEAKVKRTPGRGCWNWPGAIGEQGYGRERLPDGRSTTAHRVAWTLAWGPIPAGLSVLHRCDNGRCVRVSHLFLGTPRDNTADMIAKGRRRGGSSLYSTLLHPERHWTRRVSQLTT